MGDHRALITIKVHFHDKDYVWEDAWINYQGFDGVDPRVIEFFENMWDDGYGRWLDEVHAYELERDKEKIEQAERSELARLKAKYE